MHRVSRLHFRLKKLGIKDESFSWTNEELQSSTMLIQTLTENPN